MYSALLLNICVVGDDGRTAYERRKGRKFKRQLPEFGECIRYLRPESVGVDKADPRWEEGVFAGLRIESGEIFVMTKDGVIKVRAFARKPEDERWNQKQLEEGKGVPWEPIPGRGRIEVKTKVGILRGVGGGDVLMDPEIKETVVKRVYITKKDLETYGPTVGCRGCRAANRGETSIPHNERCRARIEKEIESKDPGRINKELDRMSKVIEENEERKKRRVGEVEKDEDIKERTEEVL
jgi:hypothetical protein